MINKRFLALCFALYMPLSHATYLVYNMRIRRVFFIPFIVGNKSYTFLTGLPLFFARRSHIVTETPAVDVYENRNMVGALFNARYSDALNWWIDVTTGLETNHTSFKGSDPFSASKTGLDDFLFTGGYTFAIGDRTELVIYGLGGLPAGRKVSKEDRYGPLIGSSFYSAGFGTEASHAFIHEKEQTLSFIIQQRFVHFFDRHWFPILPACDTIVPGNLTDILATVQYRRHTTAYEIGFNPTFFTNQAVKTPSITTKIPNSIRYGLYINSLHVFKSTLEHKPIIIDGGFSFSTTQFFDTKTYNVWLGLSIVL